MVYMVLGTRILQNHFAIFPCYGEWDIVSRLKYIILNIFRNKIFYILLTQFCLYP